MSINAWATALAALSTLAVNAPTRAADLYPYDPPPVRYGAPYDDPRYSDIYRHPPPPPAPKYVERYEERYTPPPYAYRSAPRAAYGCVHREVARTELERQGWHDFHNLQPSANVVHVRARRPNGALFDLTLDRCTGQILDRRYLAAAPPPSYAWRERPGLYPRY